MFTLFYKNTVLALLPEIAVLALLFLPSLLFADDVSSKEKFDAKVHEKKLEEYKQYLQSAPPSKEKEKRLANYYLTLGKKRLNQERYDEALMAFEEGETHGPEEWQFSYNRAIVYFLQKKYSESETALVSLDDDGAEQPAVLILLGRIYYEMSDLASAIDCWKRALFLSPEDQKVKTLLSKAQKDFSVEKNMDKAYSGRFVIQYDGERDEKIGQMVLDILESAYTDVGLDLNYYPHHEIIVILYMEKDFKYVTGSPDWAGGLYDGKIRVPVGGLEGALPELKALLYHEYAHVVISSITRGHGPAWLNEGLAVYEEKMVRQHTDHILKGMAMRGKLIPLNNMEKSFASLNSKKAPLAYEESFSFVKYLIENYGLDKINEVLRKLAREESITDIIGSVYGDYDRDLDSLHEDWKRTLN